MFQFWKLVLLCGLLTGTSASLLGDLGNNLKDVLDKGPGVITDIAETVVRNLTENLNLQNVQFGPLTDRLLQKAEGRLIGAIPQLLSLMRNNIWGLQVSNVRLLDIKAQPTPDGKGLELTFPISAGVRLNLPLIGKTVDLNLSLNLLGGIRVENQGGQFKPVMTKCASDPATISLSLLSRRNKLVNRLTDAASSFLSETLSTAVQTQICPLFKLFFDTLGVDTVQLVIDNLQKGIQPQSPV
ncbi:BPI fold-containing family A member 2 [Desmodus rotundus]|uniref:BPI fold-containing family A member 2 n=1 Tax=Desmodus rotundus TaxID=9430 RepID=UPI0023811DBE|nr:BPI fold-containing family A member 2 [Desmodus rotundus]